MSKNFTEPSALCYTASMTNSVTVKARGKINLSLNITGVHGGMHILDSVVAPVDVYDIVSVKFTGTGGAGGDLPGAK